MRATSLYRRAMEPISFRSWHGQRTRAAMRPVFASLCGTLVAILSLAGPIPIAAADAPYATISGAAEGPTVAVVARPSPFGEAPQRALEHMTRWTIDRGTVLLIPERRELDRYWDVAWGRSEPEPQWLAAFGDRAESIEAILDQADIVIALVEDDEFAYALPTARGHTLTATPAHAGVAAAVRVAMQNDAPGTAHDWIVRPAAASPQHAALLTITVSTKDPLKTQRPAQRARDFRSAVHAALVELRVRGAGHAVHTVAPDRDVARANRWIAIADVDGSVSSSGHGPAWLMASIAHLDGLRAEFVSIDDILDGELDRFDAVVFPGGSSGRQGRVLGARGRDVVRTFVREGGGYVGICAGAFLACADSPHDLDLIDAADESAGGSGVVMLELDPEHAAAIGVPTIAPVKHSNGPRMLLGKGDRPETHPGATEHPWGEPRVLATYTEDLVRDDGRVTELAGHPAVVQARYGRGLVVAIGPHPERAPGPQELFWQALRDASR